MFNTTERKIIDLWSKLYNAFNDFKFEDGKWKFTGPDYEGEFDTKEEIMEVITDDVKELLLIYALHGELSELIDETRTVLLFDQSERELDYLITAPKSATAEEIQDTISEVKDKYDEWTGEDVSDALFEKFGYGLSEVTPNDVVYW